ncbi:MAG: hypothetical protein P0Y49_06885 [Candidatus Pedobacter colombiensis]|uniref:Uncharacterized protein n=1 Tax=Candidatus Pedobacter colombiensis TaxID=3121371 RepID=A0AAJ5WC39_9SPHI|nr:hypothetical protein [Pedobacter sp.]WEK20860.1 MAG: hypothetical protein P0Y49_06885 [Pedobacter sp.]
MSEYLCIEMETKTTLYRYQNPFSKWLFAVVLLLSFLNFSGFSIAAVQIKTETQQTGLLGNSQSKLTKSISYKSALNQLNYIKYGGSLSVTGPHYLVARHTLLFNLLIAAHSKPNFCTYKTILFYKTITVSKNDDDHLTTPIV